MGGNNAVPLNDIMLLMLSVLNHHQEQEVMVAFIILYEVL
jgi:hypothetical protein